MALALGSWLAQSLLPPPPHPDRASAKHGINSFLTTSTFIAFLCSLNVQNE